ncbi:MAG TPA: DNA integrity scanning protein DisA nucleotide-binding domain protein [Gemmataceae bacterium]|nr:DNA integrity scanning protein DisA nucleotide-binding domain protein [Gemmataceae bacterium]
MKERLAQLYVSVGTRDLVEIAILAVAIYGVLRLLGKTRGSGMVRGLGLLGVGLFLVAQVVIASFDLTVVGKALDYLLTTVLVGLLVIFQPELRRGLMVLGRYRLLRYFVRQPSVPLADKLAATAEALSRDCIGALIAIQREVALAAYVETGERLDSEVSPALIRSIFHPGSPLHDGALILCNGRIAAAACQLPLGQPPEPSTSHMGMRHRAAIGLSDETDAVLLVVSEETGRVSLAVGGRLEPVPRENLSRRLAALLSTGDEERPARKRQRSAA